MDSLGQIAQDKKTEAILSAAKTHFVQHGFESARVSAIASDAGVAVGTIYLRYEGKAELLAGVFEQVEAKFCESMDQPQMWAIPFPERFSALVGAILKTAEAEKELGALMAMSSFANHSGESKNKKLIELIRAHLDDGAERGELRKDFESAIAAHIAHGMVEGAVRWLMDDASSNPEVVLQTITDASWRWLKA